MSETVFDEKQEKRKQNHQVVKSAWVTSQYRPSLGRSTKGDKEPIEMSFIMVMSQIKIT